MQYDTLIPLHSLARAIDSHLVFFALILIALVISVCAYKRSLENSFELPFTEERTFFIFSKSHVNCHTDIIIMMWQFAEISLDIMLRY